MKKTIIASSLAVALGVTGYSAAHGNEANAAENINNHAQLAEMAQNHPEQLNNKPLQEGSYDIHFTYNGFDYNFTSDGSDWQWDYEASNNQSSVSNISQTYNENVQSPQVVNNNQSSNYQVKTVSAPKTNNSSSNVSTAGNTSSQSTDSTSTKLGNGNTPGSTGSSAAQEMSSRTGVPASTWEHIIARESNGQSNAKNPSGASGLFQTMPGWGSTATVQDQINTAEKVYNQQGLSAWNM